MTERRIGVVILAGGESRKLGTPKQLVEFHGKSLLRRAVDAALGCVSERVVVVLGSRAEEMSEEIDDLPVETVTNFAWKDGISTSLRKGLAKLVELDASAAVIMLSDQPLVSEKTIRSLIDKYASSGKPIVASGYDDVLGVPALFDREVFDELLELEGDTGARAVIRRSDPSRIAMIDAPEAAFDVDTPEDRQKLESME